MRQRAARSALDEVLEPRERVWRSLPVARISAMLLGSHMAQARKPREPEKSRELPVLAPASATAWHAWLKAHHARSTGVLLRIPKGAVKGTLSYAAALDAALAWGWIDSQKRALDASAWLQRFTPRTAHSPWSKINCVKAEALIANGGMRPPGLAQVERAKQDGRWRRAYSGAKAATVPPDLARALKAKPKALAFFEQLDGANRYAILYRVTTAKLPETRARRIEQFVALCAAQKTLHAARKRNAH
jgi:uncharacterized protein YdeI (YjbR/CyaY-like superfamily)